MQTKYIIKVKNMKIDEFLSSVSRILGIDDHPQINTCYKIFEQTIMPILKDKIVHVSNALDSKNIEIRFKLTGTGFLNIHKQDEMLVNFKLLLYIDDSMIGTIDSYNKFTIHKSNILDLIDGVNTFISRNGDILDKEVDLFKRLKNMKIQDFRMRSVYNVYQIDEILSEDNEIYSIFYKVEAFKNFENDFYSLIKYLHGKKLYDFEKIIYIKFIYIISNDNRLSILLELEDANEYYNQQSTPIFNPNYKNEKEFKEIVLNIFVQTNILDANVMTLPEDTTIEEIFEISKLWKY